MENFRKTKGVVTGLLAVALAFGMMGSAQAKGEIEIAESVTGSISDASVGASVTVGDATLGCMDVNQCTFKFATTPEISGKGSVNTGDYTFIVPDFGTYTVEITGKRGTSAGYYVSTWTIVAPSAPSAPSVAEAKKYSVTVTGYAYKKTGKSTLDERRCAAVSSYLQSLGLDSTNSTYSEAGVELSKNTRSARSAVVSVTYMKDGASVTVKKRIYFTAKKSTLSKASKAKLNAFVSSVK